MGEQTAIAWTDHTFNPWKGCTKISAGCAHCYAETLLDKRWKSVEWGPLGERIRTTGTNWKSPLRWQRVAAADTITPHRRVFCSSLADVFEEKADQPLSEWRDELWEIIKRTPNLEWLLLTKRPQNIVNMSPGQWRTAGQWPHNVWIGTSVEHQGAAEERIPALLSVHAPRNFLSIEPLLAPVDISEWVERLQWVIVGGESGTGFRACRPDWVRKLRDQCVEAGVPFFFKQWGGVRPTSKGHLLDGQEWRQFPAFGPIPLRLRMQALRDQYAGG